MRSPRRSAQRSPSKPRRKPKPPLEFPGFETKEVQALVTRAVNSHFRSRPQRTSNTRLSQQGALKILGGRALEKHISTRRSCLDEGSPFQKAALLELAHQLGGAWMNKEEARKADNRWSSNSGSGKRLVIPAGLSSPPPPPHRAAREPPRSRVPGRVHSQPERVTRPAASGAGGRAGAGGGCRGGRAARCW